MTIESKHIPISTNNLSEITENYIIDNASIRVNTNSIQNEDIILNPDSLKKPRSNANIFEWMQYEMKLDNVRINCLREIKYIKNKIRTIENKTENLEKKIKEMKEMNKEDDLIEILKDMINNKEAKFKEKLKELNDGFD